MRESYRECLVSSNVDSSRRVYTDQVRLIKRIRSLAARIRRHSGSRGRLAHDDDVLDQRVDQPAISYLDEDRKVGRHTVWRLGWIVVIAQSSHTPIWKDPNIVYL